MRKICISVTSHALDPLPCHKLSHLGPLPHLERDVLYVGPYGPDVCTCTCMHVCKHACIYVRIYLSVGMCVCMYVCVRVCMNACMHVYMKTSVLEAFAWVRRQLKEERVLMSRGRPLSVTEHAFRSRQIRSAPPANCISIRAPLCQYARHTHAIDAV